MPPRKPTAKTLEPAAMLDPQHDTNAMILGEMRGQLREVVHGQNNLSMKVDGLTREVVGLASMASDIGMLKAKVDALSAEQNRTDGAKNILGALWKSPAFGWLCGMAVAAWAFLYGKAPH